MPVSGAHSALRSGIVTVADGSTQELLGRHRWVCENRGGQRQTQQHDACNASISLFAKELLTLSRDDIRVTRKLSRDHNFQKRCHDYPSLVYLILLHLGHPFPIHSLTMSSRQRTEPPNRIGGGNSPLLWRRCRVLLEISSIFANVLAEIIRIPV